MNPLQLAFLALVAVSIGCASKDEDGCEGESHRVCSWNAETQAYDRNCRTMCDDVACLPPSNGFSSEMRCRWDDATSSYSAGCSFGACPPTEDAGYGGWSDGGICDNDASRTEYFSNDPRCLPRD